MTTKYIEELIDEDEYIKQLKYRSLHELVHINGSSILGKRKFDSSFGQEEYDTERYGQQISRNYFQSNIGHCVTEPARKK
jgi:hypothetical protein